jgi:hypothetical protein
MAQVCDGGLLRIETCQFQYYHYFISTNVGGVRS